MSKISNIGTKSATTHPGSYEIKEALVYPSNQQGTNPIRFAGVKDGVTADMIMKMEMTEDLSTPYIRGSIFIQDSANILQRLKLNGGERLELTVQRSNLLKENNQPTKNQKWKLDTIITEINGYSRQYASRQFYRLNFVSPQLVISNAKTLKSSFDGIIGDLITDIMNGLGITETAGIFNISTKQSVKGVYPMMKPLKAATWLLNNAYTANGMPFFLYETCHKGMHLDDLGSMYEKEVYQTYEFKNYYEFQQGSAEYYDELSKRILKISSPYNYSQFANVGSGVYASRGNFLDIYDKTYKTVNYNYKIENKTTLNQHPPFSLNEKIQDKFLDELNDAKDYYVNLNSGAFSRELTSVEIPVLKAGATAFLSKSNFHAPLNITILEGEANYMAMHTHTMEIVVHGDFGLEVGKVIQIDISKATSIQNLENEINMIDKFIGGKYLIKKIVSNFEQEFKQTLTLVRDSLPVNIDSVPVVEEKK